MNEAITVAFSGGADSLCLLAALALVHPDKLEAVYVNHNLRDSEELEAEISLNKKNCELLGIPLTVITLEAGEVMKYGREKKLSLEAAARELRYQHLEEVAKGYIATAHTQSDQIESLMMKLLWGSTLQALAGIYPIKGRIIRPVLKLRREDTLSYCREKKLLWSEDSTNEQLFCNRNKVRHLLAPALSPAIQNLLLQISDNVQKIVSNSEKINITSSRGYHYFSFEEYSSATPLAKREVLYRAISLFDDTLLSNGQLMEIDNAIEKGRLYEGRLFYLRRAGLSIRIFPRFPFFATSFFKAEIPFGLKLQKSENTKALRFDYSLFCGNALLRLSEAGDEIELLEGRKKVSELLSEWKIPYALVVEDGKGLCAVFAEVFSGKDRLARRFISSAMKEEAGVAIS